MFAKFFTPFTSKESNYKSNISVISAANYLVNSICGTIYHNATSYIHSKITNNKETTSQSTASSKDKTLTKAWNESDIIEIKNVSCSTQDPKYLETRQDEELNKLFSGCEANFPQDYAEKLHAFHQIIPDTQFTTPVKEFLNQDLSRYNNYPRKEVKQKLKESYSTHIKGELKKPINTPAQLITMAKKWLRFQEIWGENCNKRYYIIPCTKIKYPYNYYETSPAKNYKQVIAISKNTNRLYHKTLISIFKEPESLKNLILILGLEYSFTHLIEGHDTQMYVSYCVPPRLNSVEHILHTQKGTPNKSFNISTTLLHLAVKQNILPKVSFLLTKANVNCEGYDLSFNHKNGIYVITSLDNPLKIAIDNFDSANIDILLAHGADLKMMVINDKLPSEYYAPPIPSHQQLFSNKNP